MVHLAAQTSFISWALPIRGGRERVLRRVVLFLLEICVTEVVVCLCVHSLIEIDRVAGKEASTKDLELCLL